MSRIGKLPVELPSTVNAVINANNQVVVKGPNGELSDTFNPDLKIQLEDNIIVVTRPSDRKEHRALHGLTRALIANMVEGVSQGFTRELEIVGVGYRAQLSGKNLVLNVGYSHPVEIVPPEGVSFEVPANTQIFVKGADKQKVGQVAANIRKVRPPEPYKGKGIRYKDEYVARKVGKTGM
ncbi:MAG: 50S ribosomal protein L6 [Christensenellaceae bacterium]|jgi:large subunit ribosomal protein L6